MTQQTTSFSVRMDKDVKQGLDKFCKDVGITATAAINLFARTVVREQRLPFEISTRFDPFFSEANQRFLRESIAQLNRGEGERFDDVGEVLASRP